MIVYLRNPIAAIFVNVQSAACHCRLILHLKSVMIGGIPLNASSQQSPLNHLLTFLTKTSLQLQFNLSPKIPTKMMIPFLTKSVQSVATLPPPAVLTGVTNHATSFALHLRGGAAAAFDVGMAKTRLEGL